MTTFQRVFGGGAIAPALSDYSAVTFNDDVTLQWPIEAVPVSAALMTAAKIIDATATAAGKAITLPEANRVSRGYTIFINNVGANSFTVKDNAGNVLVPMNVGISYLLYLVDSADAAGTWHVIQIGAVPAVPVASALAGAGLKVTGSLLALTTLTHDHNNDYTVGESDRATSLRWTGGAGTFHFPDPTTMAVDFFVLFRNAGSGVLTLLPDAGTLNGVASLQLNPGGSGIVINAGGEYYTVGIGDSDTVGFDYTAIAVPGTGNYTLSGSELNRIAYKFTGILTGARNVIVPNTVQQYWMDNSTTGAFTLTVKTAAGAGVTVTQGQRAILYCNGVDVVDADTAGIATPVAVAQGGTGAVTAGAARSNLGSTAVGDAIFTAASAAAARAALAASATGDALFTAVSAAAARVALGSTAVGDAIFVAATAAVARAALLSSAVGDAIFVAATAAVARAALGATAVGDAVFIAVNAAAARLAIGAPGSTYNPQAGNYSIDASDLGGIVVFQNSGSLVTMSAALGAGFYTTILNGSNGNITIDPSGGQTLDGLATRVMRPNDRVTIYSDGVNLQTLRGRYSFTSAEIDVDNNSQSINAHGLGVIPNKWRGVLRYKGAGALGYVAGQEIPLGGDYGDQASSAAGVQVVLDATNITLLQATIQVRVLDNDATPNVAGAITAADWKFELRAYDEFV